MKKKHRKNYSAEEKVAILKQHLLEQKPVSDIWDQYTGNQMVFRYFQL